MDQSHMPGRAVGLVLLCIGFIGLLLTLATSIGAGYTWFDWAFGPFVMAVGLGLLFSQRWAWVLAVLLAAAGVVFGVIAVASPGDITELGLQIGGLILYLIPGAVLLAILLRPVNLRWVRHRDLVSAVPRRPDEPRVGGAALGESLFTPPIVDPGPQAVVRQTADHRELGFSTPEEAALSDWDPRWARVVGVRQVDDDQAEVELATNEPPSEYAYFEIVEKRGGRWHPISSHT